RARRVHGRLPAARRAARLAPPPPAPGARRSRGVLRAGGARGERAALHAQPGGGRAAPARARRRPPGPAVPARRGARRAGGGPPLLPRRVVRRQVLRDPELARLVRRIAAERGVPRRRVWKEARGDFDEMAANFNGLYFGLLEAIFNRIWPRVFTALEIVGLENVIECVKEHPVVLVPCHRSHFDYLILSYIF